MSARPNSLAARGAQATLHGFSDPAALLGEGALPFVRGHGVFVEDEAGRRHLDAMAGLWCASLGFSGAPVARLAEAARQQLAALPFEHTFYGRSNPAVVDLCERPKATGL
jgi:4-aminobutyrate--pyruvate transaminase